MSRQKRKKKNFICFCNGVEQKTIEDAIRNGAHNIDEIFDQTAAGVGACGGSCRPDLKHLLEQFLATGEFPVIEKKKRNG